MPSGCCYTQILEQRYNLQHPLSPEVSPQMLLEQDFLKCLPMWKQLLCGTCRSACCRTHCREYGYPLYHPLLLHFLQGPLRPGRLYIEIIRGTPILLQIYVFYFILPQLFPLLNFSSFIWVAIALCVNSAAYVSEVIRSGIQAVDKGQTEAARSLGMSQGQTMLRIILPQAIRNILPAMGNEFIMILKETSLASTFFIGDIMTAHKIVAGAEYLVLESLIIVGCIYFCMTFPLSKLVGLLEKKMSNPNSYRKHNRKRSIFLGGKVGEK